MRAKGKTSLLRVTLIGALSAFASIQVPAAEPAPGSLPTELLECRREANDARRLACFDREIARAAPSAEQRFGYRGAVARERIDREKTAAPALERLQAKVLSVSTTASGDWVATLDNGQVWLQVPTGTRFSLRVGDSVIITPGALGSFLLRKGSSESSVRVRRRR